MKNIFSVFKRKKSGEVAKDRLKILLISDRVNCSPEIMERIKADIADVISKYMKIDVESMVYAIEPLEELPAILADGQRRSKGKVIIKC